MVAEHADVRNHPGDDLEDTVRRGALLDGPCAEIGRDPASIARSLVLPVSYDDPGRTRDAADRAIDAGFGHPVLSLPAPYPAGVVRWVVDEVVAPSCGRRRPTVPVDQALPNITVQ